MVRNNPPTASARRVRRQVQEQEREREQPTTSRVRRQVQEREREQEDEREQEQEEQEQIPGGPIDESILTNFREHVAFSIWNNKERGVLKCISHGAKLSSWAIPEDVPYFSQLINRSGLETLRLCSYNTINRVLVSAFVERWHSATNTFHLPFGEMTITLDDVSCLLHIPISGRFVSNMTIPDGTDMIDYVHTNLGAPIRETIDELNRHRGSSVGLEWLRSNCSNITSRSSQLEIQQSARAYLLYLLGCTLFTDKTVTKVSLAYLPFLVDLDSVGDYAWGAAGLAFLYKHLGSASKANVAQIAGYLTLLEAWIFEHFPTIRSYRNMSYTHRSPRAMLWEPTRDSVETAQSNLRDLRERLDMLEPHEVVWTPFADSRLDHPFEEISLFVGCLKTVDTIEPYHPGRVLRQFGYVQNIPSNPFSLNQSTRGMTFVTSRGSYEFLAQYWEDWENHILNRASLGRRARYHGHCAQDYSEWYSRISHRQVQNPAHRSDYYPSNVLVDHAAEQVSRVLNIVDPVFERGSSSSQSEMWSALRQIHEAVHDDPTMDSQVYTRRNRRM